MQIMPKILQKRRPVGATISCFLAAWLMVVSSVALAEHPVPAVHDRAQLLFLLDRLGLYPGPERGAEKADVDADLSSVAQDLQLSADPADNFAELREFLRRHARLSIDDFKAYALIYKDPSAGVVAEADWDEAKFLSGNFENQANVREALNKTPVKYPGSEYAVLAQTIIGETPPPAAPDQEEARYWRLIGDLAFRTGDPAVLAAYLNRYPRGAFAKEAIGRMAAAAGVAGRTSIDAIHGQLWEVTHEKAIKTRDPGYLEIYDAIFPDGANQSLSKSFQRALQSSEVAAPTESTEPTAPPPPDDSPTAGPDATAVATSPTSPPAEPTPADIERDLTLSKADWRRVQQALLDLGFSTGSADGKPGRKTRRALKKWQGTGRLTRTGYLTAPQIAQLEAEQKVALANRPSPGDPAAKLAIGAKFEDCTECPRLKVLPKGVFWMGSPTDERGRNAREGPRRRVAVLAPFAMGLYPVTFKEWDACVADGGCNGYRPDDAGWGRGDRPAINVGWQDAQLYVAWLRRKTGKPYRLPSEAEWEYAARAGTTTPFSTGRAVKPSQANYNTAAGYGGSAKQASRNKTLPVDQFPPNPFGLFDVHGNTWEWVEDCWHEGYDGAPYDAGVWKGGNCKRRIVRGGSWKNIPAKLRSAERGVSGVGAGGRNTQIGFRVARDLVN